jgi:hypothetical protein
VLAIDTKTGEAIYGKLLDIVNDMGEVKGTLGEVLKQTINTNGRVTKLEEEVQHLKLLKFWIMGMGAGLSAVIVFLWKMLEVYEKLKPLVGGPR